MCGMRENVVASGAISAKQSCDVLLPPQTHEAIVLVSFPSPHTTIHPRLSPRASRTDDYDDDDYDEEEPEELVEGRGDAEREDAEFGLQVHDADVHAEAGQVPLQSSGVRIHAGVFNDLGCSFAVCAPTGGRFGK